MQYLPHINRKLIVVLLLMQVSIAYALPAWASINLCIGFDGHVDFERRGFVGGTTQPFYQLTVVSSDDDHHGDCFDFMIGGFSFEHLCVRAEEFRRRNGENLPEIEGEGALPSHIGLSQLSPSLTFYPYNGTTPLSTITLHRTVVLLI